MNGVVEASFQVFEEGAKLSEEVGDQKSIANFCALMSNYYVSRSDLLKSTEYAEKGFHAAVATNDIDIIAPTAADLINTYTNTGQVQKSVDFAPGVLDRLEKEKKEFDFYGRPIVPYTWLCLNLVQFS